MRFFVATRSVDVPPGLDAFASVDGSVPGALVTWDHHVTGERVNWDTLPAHYDTSVIRGIGTTSADTDAVASAVGVALGGTAHTPPPAAAVLRSASHWCDHLAADARLDAAVNRLGRGLHEWVTRRLQQYDDRSRAFDVVVRELLDTIRADSELPFLQPPDDDARAQVLLWEGLVVRRGAVALVDLTGQPPIQPLAVYAAHMAAVAVILDRGHPRGRHYTVGVNPLVEHPADLRPALEALAVAEYAHGPPALTATPGPGTENWGGRATVFGSPWNYASRIEPDDVVFIVRKSLGLA